MEWAFYFGPATVAALQARTGVMMLQEPPTIRTRMITFYSHATGKLAHDEMDFFMH